MKPYYEHDGITIYHGDCREIIPDVGQVNLVLTDAPYNGDIKYGDGTNDSRDFDEYVHWLNGILLQCESICSGPVLCFVSKPGLVEMCRVRRPWWIGQWVGACGNPAGPNNGVMFQPNYEPCLFYGNRYGVKACIPDTWRFPPESERNGHPCPKPLHLITKLLTLLPTDSVMDPFCGSGTTLRAAKDLGRKAIGIEIEERYCEIAAKRLGQEVFRFEPATPIVA